MALYTMADFHLSESTGKPMDIFGPVWENHSKKIAENWPLTENDAIVMPGDFSWAMTLEEVRADFEFLAKLKGKKKRYLEIVGHFKKSPSTHYPCSISRLCWTIKSLTLIAFPLIL